jgi:hypothetical protein
MDVIFYSNKNLLMDDQKPSDTESGIQACCQTSPKIRGAKAAAKRP